MRDAPYAQILELTRSLDRAATYDTSYLALAQEERAPLITADKRLHNALKGRFEWLLWVEDRGSSSCFRVSMRKPEGVALKRLQL